MSGLSGLHWYGWLMLAACAGMAAYDLTVIALNARRGLTHPQPIAWFVVRVVLAVALVVS